MLVTYSLQFLLVLLLYPIPESPSNPSPKNSYRHFLGRLHRPQDFQFIVDGMTRILNQPLQEKTSYLPGTQSADHFAPEILMLFWEILQCNKRFRSFIVDTERAHDFVVLALFYTLIDVLNWRRWTFFFIVIGMNSIVIYMIGQFIDFRYTANALFGGILSFFAEPVQALGSVIATIAVLWGFMYFLYKQKLFLKS